MEEFYSSGKVYLSAPYLIEVDQPTRVWMMDGISHKRVSEILDLDPGIHRGVLRLSEPARYIRLCARLLGTEERHPTLQPE